MIRPEVALWRWLDIDIEELTITFPELLESFVLNALSVNPMETSPSDRTYSRATRPSPEPVQFFVLSAVSLNPMEASFRKQGRITSGETSDRNWSWPSQTHFTQREFMSDSDKVGADVVLLHGWPQSCMPKPVEGFLEVAMPQDFFKYTQKPNCLYFLIELFGLSTNQFEFLKSVQWFKRYTRFVSKTWA